MVLLDMSNYVVGVLDMSRVFKSAVSPCTVRGGYAAVDAPTDYHSYRFPGKKKEKRRLRPLYFSGKKTGKKRSVREIPTRKMQFSLALGLG